MTALPPSSAPEGRAAGKRKGRTPGGVRPLLSVRCQAQLDPTALSVLAMLLPADWTFWPWELACS
jgi:hypothetical protein